MGTILVKKGLTFGMARKSHLSALPKAVICIGASAGGIDALSAVVGGLPADLPAAVLVVLHLSPFARADLPSLLSERGALPALFASDGAPLLAGRIYVAPPDLHLLVERRQVALVVGPKENFSRPAIDPLFRSAAQSWGPKAIGVVLSGNLADGSAGLWMIQRSGGTTVVQDPADAKLPAMPRNATVHLKPDYQLPAAQIGLRLAALVRNLPAKTAVKPAFPDLEDAAIRNRPVGPQGMKKFGAPTPYVCPECGGPLWAARTGPPRLRCHAGHAYAAANLVAHYDEQKEAILWSAVRVLEEQAALLQGQLKQGKPTPQERKDLLMGARRNADSALIIRKLLQHLIASSSHEEKRYMRQPRPQ